MPHSFRTRDRGRLAARLLLAVIATLLALLVAEAAARVLVPVRPPLRFAQVDRVLGSYTEAEMFESDPDLFWRFVPNVTVPGDPGGPFRGVVSNSEGVRESHEIGAKADDEIRLLFLGDSSCFGVFLGPEETFVHQTEVRLLAGSQGSAHVECINAGVPGYTLFQAERLLRRLGPRYRPDLVVLYVGWNESASWDDLGDLEHWRAMRARTPPGPLRSSSLARTLWGLRGAGALAEEDGRDGNGGERARLTPGEFDEVLRRVSDAARELGSELFLIVGACRGNLSVADPNRYQEAQFAYAREQDGPLGYVDCVPLVRELAQVHGVDALFFDEVHPTALTNRVIANAVATELQPWLAAKTGE